MRNKKGFTLAELLGVIVILLLLILIITPIFISNTRKGKETAYEAQVRNIRDSARAWSEDSSNIPLLPKNDNDCVEVSLEKLKEAGLLDYNIKNPNTNEKFDDNLTVIIRKEGKDFTYTFNADGTETCDTVITSEYPKWIYVSSSPTHATAQSTVSVVIKSDRKISSYDLINDDITVKVGGAIIDGATVSPTCTNGEILTCTLSITNLSGTGKLSLIIAKETMYDTNLNPSRLTNLQTDTFVDSTGPVITYTGRTNTNQSTFYATKDDTVTVSFKAEDDGTITNNLTANDLVIYLDGTEVNCNKTLTPTGSGKEINYTLTLTNITGTGKLSIKIPANKIQDDVGNKNLEKIISPGITFDNIKPRIIFTPNETSDYQNKVVISINAYDDETGVNEETLKYIFTENTNATPNISIVNGGEITKENLTGDYYLIGYVCDNAGNCTDNSETTSGTYHLNNEGPLVTITPTTNSGYTKSANIKIKATSRGSELDEGSLKYIISTSQGASPNRVYTNNEEFTVSNLTGVYYVIAEAYDMLGNHTIETSGEFYFDNESPEVTYNANGTNNQWVKSTNVALSVTDNVELDWSKYIVSTSKTGTPNETISNGAKNVPLSGSTGIYYILVKACDKLENCKQTASLPYKLDNTGPVIAFNANGNNTYKKSQSSTVTVTDANIGTVQNLKYVWSTSNTASAKNGTGFTSGSSITKNTDSGDYYLCIYGEDGLGNSTNTCSNKFRLDNEGPTITFGTNGNTTYKKSQATTVTVTDSKNGTVKNLKYVWSTSNNDNASGGTGFTSGSTITKNTDTGIYYLCIYAEDGLGNSTNKCSNAFYIDNTQPTASITSTNSVANSQSITLTMSDNIGLAKYYFGTSNPDNTTVTWTNNTSASIAKTVNANGTYYLGVQDTAGNQKVVSKTFYKTTLDPHGGSVSPTTIITMAGNSFNIPNASYTNYTFQGWYTAASGGSKYNSPYTPSGNVTMHAQWKANTFTITYNLDGGTNNSSNPSSYKTTDGDITIKAPTRSGYAFEGWVGSNGNTPQTSVKIVSGSTGDKTYTAKWKILPKAAAYIYEPTVKRNEAYFTLILPYVDTTSGTKYQYSLDDGANWIDFTSFDLGCGEVTISLSNKNDRKYIRTRYYDTISKTSSQISDQLYIDPAMLYIWQLWQGNALVDEYLNTPVNSEKSRTFQMGSKRLLKQNFDQSEATNVYYDNYLTRYEGKMGELAIGSWIYGRSIMDFHKIGLTTNGNYKKLNIIYRVILGRSADTGTQWEWYLANRGENQNYMVNYGDNVGGFTNVCVDMAIAYDLVAIAESGEAQELYDNWGLGRADRVLPGIPECVTNNSCSAYSSASNTDGAEVAWCFGPRSGRRLLYEWEKTSSQFDY